MNGVSGTSVDTQIPATTSTSGADNSAEFPDPPPPPPKEWLPLNLAPQSALLLAGLAPAVPGIDMPVDTSNQDLFDFVTQLVGKTQEAQVRVAREGLNMSQKKLEDAHSKAVKQIENWIKNTVKAERAAHKAAGLELFKKIAMPLAAVGACALTVATAGATSGLAVMAIGMCAYTLAQQASQEAGGPSIGLADNMQKGLTQMMLQMDPGMSKEEAAKHAGLMSGGMAVLLAPQLLFVDQSFAGQLAGGIAQESGLGAEKAAILATAVTMATTVAVQVAMAGGGGGGGGGGAAKGAGDAAKGGAQVGAQAGAATAKAGAQAGAAGAKAGTQVATTAATTGAEAGATAAMKAAEAAAAEAAKAAALTKNIKLVAGLTIAATDIAVGGAGVAEGVQKIETADAQKEADLARVAQKRTNAAMLAIQAQFDDNLETLKDVAKQIDENFVLVGDVMKAAALSNSQIIRNVGRVTS